MKISLRLGLLLALLAGHAFAASAPISGPVVLSPNCTTPPNCPFVQNDSTHPFYGLDPTVNTTLGQLLSAIQAGITVNLSGIGLSATAANQVTGNASLATIVTNTTGGATSALQTTGNSSLASIVTNTTGLATAAAQTTGNGSLATLATASASQATAANQTTGNTSAATTATNTGTIATNTGSTATNTSTTATNTGTISTTTGAIGDSAYAGSGNSTLVSGLKGIYAKLAGTLTISGAVTTTGTTATLAAPDISTITTGGTAVNAFSAGHCTRGCLIVNPKAATIDLCVNGTGATASGTTTSGALICIPPSQQFYFTARTTAISAVSSDSAHPFGGEGYQ